MTTLNTIGERIAALRRERAMTQEELASVIGVSAQSVSKWENSITMPDIMLLPIIAGIFDVTIDEIFSGRKTVKEMTFSMDDTPEEIYNVFLEYMERAWRHGDLSEAALPVSVQDLAKEKRKKLSEQGNNTGIVSYKAGAVYANSELALCYLKDKNYSLSLLDNNEIAEFLCAVSGDAFRKILKYQLENTEASFTAASVSNKCGIEEGDAEKALSDLVKYKFLTCRKLDTGTDELLNVYHLCGEHKIGFLLYPFLSIAGRLVNFSDSWFGLRG